MTAGRAALIVLPAQHRAPGGPSVCSPCMAGRHAACELSAANGEPCLCLPCLGHDPGLLAAGA